MVFDIEANEKKLIKISNLHNYRANVQSNRRMWLSSKATYRVSILYDIENGKWTSMMRWGGLVGEFPSYKEISEFGKAINDGLKLKKKIDKLLNV